ncbi:MAG: hypothetical protein KDD00_08115 [Ignavibacteriae bacterium]|nr:hypothetical protein [Ignavibacteriota bacterium]
MRNTALVIIFLFILSVSGCNIKPVAEPLPISVTTNLSLLQENPQFVMYLNFKNMRHTDFWRKNISDSLLNAEKTFGSLLNTFKEATGASISDGIDELYYSNSWFGENAIILKGVFKREKLDSYIETDSIFSVAKFTDGTKIYIKNDNGLYFYFRDDYTICASNYLKQIDEMMQVNDTVKSGLLLNQDAYSSIENIIYKENLWMVTTEKLFIRGIFQNFLESTSDRIIDMEDTTGNEGDSISVDEKPNIVNLYKRLNSVSFSAKMDEDLKFLIQGECINNESSKYLKSLISGLITVGKLKSAGKKNQNAENLLDKIKLDRYDSSVFVELSINENTLNDLKKIDLMNEPGIE